MDVGSFHKCCGFNIIYDFQRDYPRGYPDEYFFSDDEIEEMVALYIERQYLYNRTGGSAASGLLVALNHNQRRYGEILRKLGWRCLVKDMFHPAHKSQICLWLFSLYEDAEDAEDKKHTRFVSSTREEWQKDQDRCGEISKRLQCIHEILMKRRQRLNQIR